MPITEKLQAALADPHTELAQLAELLKKDGIATRDTLTFDTPLIIAARHNNLTAAEYIVQHAKDKNDLINQANKKQETALSLSLHFDDKRLALYLIKVGANPSKANVNLPPEAQKWLSYFTEFQKLHGLHSDDPQHVLHKAQLETMIANFYLKGDDVVEAKEWYELAAKDGDPDAMIRLAKIYHHTLHDLTSAIHWYKECHSHTHDEKIRAEIIEQLNTLADVSDDPDIAYHANVTKGNTCISEGKVTEAFNYFKKAEQFYQEAAEHSEQNDLFFHALSLWNGPSSTYQTTAMDYLDIAKRFESLHQTGLEEAYNVIRAFAANHQSRILQLIACVVAEQHRLLPTQKLAALADPDNKPYLAAINMLYGWQGEKKNTLRAAGALRKLTSTSNDTETTYWCHALMAFAYFQQEDERDVYVAEGFDSLDHAHAALGNNPSPHRREIILTLIDGSAYA